jgi:hypothetical protein
VLMMEINARPEQARSAAKHSNVMGARDLHRRYLVLLTSLFLQLRLKYRDVGYKSGA